MNNFIKKNGILLLWLAVFYITAVAAVSGGGPAGVKESFYKNVLTDCGYKISYEVVIAGGGAAGAIEFYSAESCLEKNKLHIAVVNDPSLFEAGVDFGAGLKILSESADAASGAVLAINGGYFAIIKDKIYSVGKVCKNYEIYPDYIRHDAYPYLCVDAAGKPDVLKASGFNKKNNNKSGYKDFIQTKPMLVYNGAVPASLKANRAANESKNPRTAVAVTADKKIICMIVEGRQEFIEGMSQVGLAELLIKMKAVRAINLDGGGSSSIVLNGCLMNRPSGGFSPFVLPGRQRPLHSIIYFKPKPKIK
jgi:exopolysaccharide biosynthesis protein